ncbi:unnamed protein product, partial [Rotaria sordida]
MPNMYRCVNSSKCISKYRLNDGISDCYFDDDEKYLETENICSPTSNIKCYECTSKSKSIHYNRLKDGLCDCPHYCDDEVPIDHIVDIQEHISFQTICDGFTELLPIMIDGQNETDETNCGQWVCDNIYTRCDDIWNCPNGADELNCPNLCVPNCTSNEHTCVSPKGNEFMCLPIEKANGGVVDCLGATDEPHICRNSVSTRILPPPNQNKNLQQRCNRGMDMRVWLGDKDNSTTTTCLCPPSYYGDTCQYQNQR